MASKIKQKILLYRLQSKPDPAAFAQLYDIYVKQIYRFVYFKVSSHEEAEDITSEVFLKTWRYINDKSKKKISSFSGLLYRLARNAIVDLYRVKAKRPEVSLNYKDENKKIEEKNINDIKDIGDKRKWEKEIEIKDVWVIDLPQMAMLRQEAKDILEAFKKTNYLERAQLLYAGIDKKLKDVEQMQEISSASPSYKISNYRNSLSLFNSAKADLLAAKTLLSEVTPKGLAKLTWKIILFIIIFLGILAASFSFIWQRQSKLEAEQQKPPEQQN